MRNTLLAIAIGLACLIASFVLGRAVPDPVDPPAAEAPAEPLRDVPEERPASDVPEERPARDAPDPPDVAADALEDVPGDAPTTPR